jgi:hypothetical protein
VWYHLLYENSLSVLKVLDDNDLLDSPSLGQEAAVLFAARKADWVMEVRVLH